VLCWEELKRLAPAGIFWGAYTLLFLLWKITFFYTLPFLLGLLVAAILQPVIRFAEHKLHLNHNWASGGITALALSLFLIVLLLLLFVAAKEMTNFLIKATQGGFPEFSPAVQSFFRQIGGFFQSLDGNFWERNRQNLVEFFKNSAGLAVTILSQALAVLTSLPTLLALLLATAFSAYFFAKDYGTIKAWGRRILGKKTLSLARAAVKSSSGTGRRYALSYALIYFISFCEAFVILSILGIPYPLLTAVLTCIADVLPVLGPGIVFTPVAVYQALIGEYGRSIGVLIGWLVMTCIRQVVEPKLVASTVKIHPLAMLAAVYFSLAAGSLWVLLYTAGFFTLYAMLRTAGILPALSPPPSKAE